MKLPVVQPLDNIAMEKARQRQAELAKPPGSLGRLEDLSVQLAGKGLFHAGRVGFSVPG